MDYFNFIYLMAIMSIIKVNIVCNNVRMDIIAQFIHLKIIHTFALNAQINAKLVKVLQNAYHVHLLIYYFHQIFHV